MSHQHIFDIIHSDISDFVYSALDTCDVKLLLKIGTLLPELAAQEKTVDGFIEMLRKDLLDENIALEPIYKIIVYYQVLFDQYYSYTFQCIKPHQRSNLYDHYAAQNKFSN